MQREVRLPVSGSGLLAWECLNKPPVQCMVCLITTSLEGLSVFMFLMRVNDLPQITLPVKVGGVKIMPICQVHTAFPLWVSNATVIAVFDSLLAAKVSVLLLSHDCLSPEASSGTPRGTHKQELYLSCFCRVFSLTISMAHLPVSYFLKASH